MFFGALPLHEAEGGILAHRLVLADGVLKKGTVLEAEHLARLAAAGMAQVTVAKLGPGDVAENEAAARIGAAIAGAGVRVDAAFTGRVNLFAEQAGLLTLERAAIDALNGLDEAITLATLPPFARVEPGAMLATVKIIPYAAPDAAVTAAAALGPLIAVAPFTRKRVAMVATTLPGLGDKVLAKTRAITEARLAALGAHLIAHTLVAHEEMALAEAIGRVSDADLLLIFGASAISDRKDVIPAAIERAGGVVERFGMPVDPGNLLLLGHLGAMPVIGAPGCSRSPKLNGFDDVLARLIAGLSVGTKDIQTMGVGGLLTEIPTRPQPRAGKVAKIGALVLAAGRSSRMRGPNKLLASFGGEPMVHRVVRQVRESGLFAELVVVSGHQADAVAAALASLDVVPVFNPDFAEGLSTSLKAGLKALPPGLDGVMVLLGDMPMVGAETLQKLTAAFAPERIVVPVVGGQRGNPVLWGRAFIDALATVSGDAGGRALMAGHGDAVVEVVIADDGPLIDLDTPEAFDAHAPK